ncbi:AAA family ATPase [Flavobacterium oreochromis]|uniref:AAA family ATPase n=1 Tax=Flavobacterium oreochromis TaxID=2906078 RepID=UPI001CE62876|nr:AAA family ATPase [Flavobacterium oreochromis]QYS85446.1 AAA family ATPase [Flavobacterium oreochromis]
MRTINIKKIQLINFKGIKNLTIDFDNKTDILGANGTGKTTIADAFTWLLFGKDSTDRKEFEIKTLDEVGNVIPMIDHEVSAELIVDSEILTIKRVLRENWVKKRGYEEREFGGNKIDLYWNEVPMTITEFNKKINTLLDEQVFKMITSPTYFNSIKWPDRRNLLIDIFGEVSNEDVARGNSAFEKLLAKLTQGKTLDDYKAQILASIKKAKEDLKNIPSRIDEVFRGKPEAQDFEVLEKQKASLEIQLNKVDLEISDVNKAFDSKLASQREQKLRVNNLKSDLEIIEQNAKKEAENRLKSDTSILDSLVKQKTDKEQELQSYESALKTLKTKKEGIEDQISSTEKQMEDKRQQWHEENNKTLEFDTDDCTCPTCKQALPTGDIEAKKSQAITNFNTTKLTNIRRIEAEGTNLKAQKENLEAEIKTFEARIETGKGSVENAKTQLQEIIYKIESENSTSSEMQTFECVYESLISSNKEYQEKSIELSKFKESNEEVGLTVDNSELIEKRKSLVFEIDNLKSKLQTKAQIESAEIRIAELQQEEKTLAQQIANVEKEQFIIENFIKAKVNALEDVVNSKFKFVKFKMFDQQINGGFKDTCEVTVNGVPYSDINTASKINAGLDVINVLSEFYGISAPIFIDNAESVHTLIDTKSQLIRLVVSENDTKLRITTKELEIAQL